MLKDKSSSAIVGVDDLDSARLADAVHDTGTSLDRPVEALVQVNIAGEATKGGFSPDELPGEELGYTEGSGAMANAGANTNGSQFFIVYGDTTIPSDPAGGYTVIGQVTSGLDQLKESVISLGTEGGVPDGL